jgi:hypothetical protein
MMERDDFVPTGNRPGQQWRERLHWRYGQQGLHGLMRRVLLALCCGIAACMLLGAAPVVAAEAGGSKIALVIGNGAYAGVGELSNPVNDAIDVAAKLRQLGFDVTLRTDADYLTMRRALTDFGRQVKEGSVVLFYYAGHGMQVRGKNYLLPVDARIQIENDVGTEGMDVDFLLDKLSPARLSLVILDACRNNPFERRFRGGSGAGLAHMAAPTGTLIAYSTAPGKVAADGEGRNGLYTGELLKAMSVARPAGRGGVQAGTFQRRQAERRYANALGSLLTDWQLLFRRPGHSQPAERQRCAQWRGVVVGAAR